LVKTKRLKQGFNEGRDAIMKLTGKIGLITGATSGIGRATSLVFAREGAALMLTGRNTGRGQDVLTEVTKLGCKAGFIAGDVSEYEFAERAVKETVERFGRLDILFNNAGVFEAGTAEGTTIEAFRYVMEVNVFGVFYFCRAAIPVMRGQGEGVIINNASDWGLVGGPKAVAYCCSKGAVVQMTKAMALDHAREGIRINAICPGDTLTPMQDGQAKLLGVDREELKVISGEALPIGRMAEAEEIAKSALFLACDDSSFITGIVLPVDGGNTCQ
jgi:meso-butanediol dehydrogenase/(S,S)-butanediol dehydrogenase/diacetyl reductase